MDDEDNITNSDVPSEIDTHNDNGLEKVLKKKRRRASQFESHLIDMENLRNAITYVIHKSSQASLAIRQEIVYLGNFYIYVIGGQNAKGKFLYNLETFVNELIYVLGTPKLHINESLRETLESLELDFKYFDQKQILTEEDIDSLHHFQFGKIKSYHAQLYGFESLVDINIAKLKRLRYIVELRIDGYIESEDSDKKS